MGELALFDSDNEAALVKDPNTPVQTNKRLEAAKDDGEEMCTCVQ